MISIKQLQKVILNKENEMFSQNDVLFARNVLTDKVLSGWYGVDIMLDYLDYIGGNSAELMEIADAIGIKISVEFKDV